LAFCILTACASQHDGGTETRHSEATAQTAIRGQVNDPNNPYQRGLSTETQLMVARGQPISRSIAPDGTITDIYPAGIDLAQMKKMQPDGTFVSFADMAASLGDKKADFIIKNHYVYSPDGILQKILIDMPDIGPNGEVVHHVSDTAEMQIKITGRHKASS
jgi:hypothetical protein